MRLASSQPSFSQRDHSNTERPLCPRPWAGDCALESHISWHALILLRVTFPSGQRNRFPWSEEALQTLFGLQTGKGMPLKEAFSLEIVLIKKRVIV